MLFDKELEFPLYISVNLLVVSPQKFQAIHTDDGNAVDSEPRSIPISDIGAIAGPSSINAGNEAAAAPPL